LLHGQQQMRALKKQVSENLRLRRRIYVAPLPRDWATNVGCIGSSQWDVLKSTAAIVLATGTRFALRRQFIVEDKTTIRNFIGNRCSLFYRPSGEDILRIAMTASDIPRTTGSPDNGFEGLAFWAIRSSKASSYGI
jgi:hypothetical protein